jgi:hypothetical protein
MAGPDRADGSERRPLVDRAWIVNFSAGVVRWVTAVFAAVLAVHILLTLGNTNPESTITVCFRHSSEVLVLGFGSLFTPKDATLGVLLGNGLAVLFWLLVGRLTSGLLRQPA